MVDLGVMFCNSDLEPYDILMPDIDFIINRKKDLSAIILTHAHEDHIADVETIVKKTKAKIVSNYEIVNHFAEKGDFFVESIN